MWCGCGAGPIWCGCGADQKWCGRICVSNWSETNLVRMDFASYLAEPNLVRMDCASYLAEPNLVRTGFASHLTEPNLAWVNLKHISAQTILVRTKCNGQSQPSSYRTCMHAHTCIYIYIYIIYSCGAPRFEDLRIVLSIHILILQLCHKSSKSSNSKSSSSKYSSSKSSSSKSSSSKGSNSKSSSSERIYR